MGSGFSARASHAFVEHTGEVALTLDASSVPALFAEAARALCELTAGEEALTAHAEPLDVQLTARDLPALLVAWLDELIYLGEVHKLVFPEAHIDSLEGACLRATVRGTSPAYVKTSVKAATLHDLELAQDERGVHAKVVLDV